MEAEKKQKYFFVPHARKNPIPGRMIKKPSTSAYGAQTPRADMGDSVGRFRRYQ